MTSLGIIPARYHSSRLPGKPLANILGKSMIQRVYEQAQQSKLDKIIVATDDQRIVDEVRSFGGLVVMTSDEHISGTDRCLEALQSLGEKYDTVVNIQGDEPLADYRQLDQLCNAFEDENVSIATLL